MECECLIEMIGFIVTIAGFIITIITLKKGQNDLRISNVLKLKEIFNEYLDIHSKLSPNGEWNNPNFNFNNISSKEFSKFNDYAGIFEAVKLMLENGSLKQPEFKTFFLYRLSNIATCKAAMENIYENIDNWTNLIDLMNQFNLINEHNN
ncbi:hypothetical protein [uncultured Flavobacterium sp.]|uniref:hypothetical protein n=1 Tax=uncultured Flavobacterium sp. TaxID=165435 RepID=UPI002603AC91|nr:hypothetical protein [uncultured Flavobacterium sp.]